MSNLAYIHQPPTLDQLAAELIEAKAAESAARLHRNTVEAQIIDQVGVKEEGAQTIKSDLFSVTTTGKLTRTIDREKLIAVAKQMPRAILDRVVEAQPKLNLRELKYIRDNEPHIYTIFSDCLTIKPAKTAVAVKEVAA